MKKQWSLIVIVSTLCFIFLSCEALATLAHGPKPEDIVITIYEQPKDQNLNIGSISGNLTVGAKVTHGTTLSYQWYNNTTNSNTSGIAITIGGSGESFTIPTTLSEGTYYYFCEISATGGVVSLRSNVATVTVTLKPIITINTQPTTSSSVTAGSIIGGLTVSATVTKGATLSYQWYRNTMNSNNGGTAIIGATSASFAIPTTLSEGTYYYFCEITATGGAVPVRSDVATVVVSVPIITINTQPATSTSVNVGKITGILTVSASITHNASLSYQWYSNITNNNNGGTAINGATSANFAIPTTLSEGTYYYFCEITATGGAVPVRTNASTVTVTIVPVITIIMHPAMLISVGFENISGSLTVSATVTQGASLSYQWYSEITNSNTGGIAINGATSANFAIPTTLLEGTYYYFCEVNATSGAVPVRSNVATITVSVPVITINTHPTLITNVNVGKISGSLNVSAAVTQGATLSYQWYSSTTDSNTDGTAIDGAISASFAIPATLTEGTYYYFCEVRANRMAASVRSNVATISSKEYHLGDRGPAGGYVFYDKGIFTDGWRYLEAAPLETEFSAIWGSITTNVAGIENAVGTGKQNTKLILNSQNGNIAARICDNMTFNGFSDWFLPSIDEMWYICENLFKKNLGSFNSTNITGAYWTSSQRNISSGWLQVFYGGGGPGFTDKNNTRLVRAVRSF